jgi:hypothetical protein
VGVWESLIHEQLFLMVPPLSQRKLVFTVVYPAKEHSQPGFDQGKFIENLTANSISFLKERKNLIRLWGDRNPFSLQTGDKGDFYGVVTFELLIDDIEGFDCSNSLIYEFSRVAFEANRLTKLSFETLKDFFQHYDLPLSPPADAYMYQPSLDERGLGIAVVTPFGVCGKQYKDVQAPPNPRKNSTDVLDKLDRIRAVHVTPRKSTNPIIENRLEEDSMKTFRGPDRYDTLRVPHKTRTEKNNSEQVNLTESDSEDMFSPAQPKEAFR